MKFHLLTIFPEFFSGPFSHGVVAQVMQVDGEHTEFRCPRYYPMRKRSVEELREDGQQVELHRVSRPSGRSTLM